MQTDIGPGTTVAAATPAVATLPVAPVPPVAAAAPVASPAAGATAAIAAPSATPARDPVADFVDTLDPSQSVVSIPRDPMLVLPPMPADNLWERIRRGFAMPNLETPLAENRTRWYAGQGEYIDRMAQRSQRYLFHIVEEIERRRMPTELALLPFVESAFQPEAISSAKAAGLWQFIPSTGKDYDLAQNMWHDERRDVIESTRAALDYLQKLYDMFSDWHLALAAYNWGEGAVSRAIEKNRRTGKPTGYTNLKMPQETAYYVPKLQAIKNIVSEPERWGVALPRIDNTPYFVAVPKTRDIDVDTAARLAEMNPADFRALNPAFNRPVIVGAAGTKLLLPADKVDAFHANLAAWEATGQPLASWTTHKMAPSDTLASVAKRAGISEQQLREANRVPPRYRLAAGSTILIPRDETMEEDISAASLDAHFALVPERSNLRKVTYRVRRGDTLHAVARRWNVDEKDVIVWNHLTAPALFAGQRLELTVPAPKARAARTSVAKASTGATKSPSAVSPKAGASAKPVAPAKSAAKPAPRASSPSSVRVSAAR
ncbi:MAG TPA: transglycosylase SLT domain-containing protein [Burkholderiaceae bacterium]|nr:transglycosylase SLT domain-containing protein [Burkholderiaceae bacterium]